MGKLTHPHLQEDSSGHTDRLITYKIGTENKPQAHLYTRLLEFFYRTINYHRKYSLNALSSQETYIYTI